MTSHDTSRARRGAWRLSAISIAGALALAACSSSSAKATGPTAAATGTTKAGTANDFVTAADAVCTKAGEAIGSVVGGITGKGDAATDADRAAATKALLAAVTAEIAGLAAVTPPADKKAAYEAMLASARAAAATVERQGAGFWQTQEDPFADTNAKAKALGLMACAGGPS